MNRLRVDLEKIFQKNKNPPQFDPSKMMDPAKIRDRVKDLNKMLSDVSGMMP